MKICLKDMTGSLLNCVLYGNQEIEICGITHDSRKVKPGWAYVAIPGEKSDGHDFIRSAIVSGAVAIVAQKEPHTGFDPDSIGWIKVPSTRDILGLLSSEVYCRPTDEIALVGITGTNGKTTLTYILESISRSAERIPGVVGTISYRWPEHYISAPNTTPEASDLQRMFREMKDSRVSDVFMEVSSHGLKMGRLNGCNFDVGVFTNLTQDHLDFHRDMEDYYQAKKILFSSLLKASSKKNKAAVVNVDDPFGSRLFHETTGFKKFSFGSSSTCDFYPLDVEISADGISGSICVPEGDLKIESSLTGYFNLSNIMAAVAVSVCLGFSVDSIRRGIAELRVVPGRLQRIESRFGQIFVDYAHTPNALNNVLDALRKSMPGRLITVVGCGGDRDRTKRPLMGEQAALASDFVLITSDNPRTEDPMDIISQIEPGVKKCGLRMLSVNGDVGRIPSGQYAIIPDRRKAIEWIVRHLEETDTLLVAGKGHENYQEINGVRYPFDDGEELRKALESLNL